MSNLGNAAVSGDDNNAPDVSMPQGPMPDVGQATPQAPNLSASSPQEQASAADGAPPSGGSRLLAILGAVARVGTTALSGIPDRGRPSFVTGLGEGARAGLAANEQQQAIKFRSFDDSLRAAQLHNDDLRIQNQTQAQQDAHVAAENTQRDYDDDHNIEYNPHPSVGDAVVQTLQARTQADPAGASIAPGTYHSADGNTLMEPDGSDTTNEGLTKKYGELQSVLNLPPMQSGSQYVSGKNLDMMGKILKGSDLSGKPLSKDVLQNYLSSRDTQRAALVKSNASQFALQTFDDLTGIYKTDLKNHQDFEDQAAAKVAQQAGQKKQSETAGEIAAKNSPEGRSLAQFQEKLSEQKQDNSAGNKAGNGGSQGPDPFGVTSPLDSKQFNSRYNTFSKAYVQPLTKTDQQLSQFASIQSDIDKNGNMTGAESVVGLFNAIGISASPLKGMGFRINNNTVEEHANARGLGQSLYQKMLSLKDGDVVTPQQLKDYASIATQARESQYSSAIDEARRQNLPVDFLPKGNGSPVDQSTVKMYLRAAGGDKDKTRAALQAAGWRF